MTDREMLELAAKAAGINALRDPNGCLRNCTGAHDMSNIFSLPLWNPLTDDGDALRLASKLGICIEFGYCLDDTPVVRCGRLYERDSWSENANFPNPEKETRRAIVRAAAEIGRDMG